MESKYIHSLDVHNLTSAKLIVPLILDLLYLKPNSVLDVGCGIGTWLNVFKDYGIKDLVGIDGDYVDKELLFDFLDEKDFIAKDLRLEFHLKRKFDLVLSLEVAEHLDEIYAEDFVSSLVSHGEIIIFSAAIPGQGGQNHMNEQWPDYWANLFNAHDYVFLDIIRPLIWNNSEVDFWYRQNIFFVVKKNHILASKYKSSHFALVHPELFKRINQSAYKDITYLKKQLEIHPLKRWLMSIIKLL